jgi:poly(ADP-ribose) glycohydrolase ARH3
MTLDARLKARGALLGAALGDALGAPYEGLPAGTARADDIDPGPSRGSPLRYTDDTAMTLALAESLVAVGDLDEDHLAATFARHWRAEPWRGYGRGTFALLGALDAGGSWRVEAPRQFGGQGSWGNGAAMRVAPVAVLAGGDPGRAAGLAARSARVTHAHPLGVEGAALQAGAVALALRTPPDEPLDRPVVLGSLLATIGEEAFAEQLRRVEALPADSPPDEVAQRIGCGIDALSSVPAALSVALLVSGSFAGAVSFAIALGGDTDTIASMAGAIVGAHLGAEAIPQGWVRRLEGRDRIVGLADAVAALATA